MHNCRVIHEGPLIPMLYSKECSDLIKGQSTQQKANTSSPHPSFCPHRKQNVGNLKPSPPAPPLCLYISLSHLLPSRRSSNSGNLQTLNASFVSHLFSRRAWAPKLLQMSVCLPTPKISDSLRESNGLFLSSCGICPVTGCRWPVCSKKDSNQKRGLQYIQRQSREVKNRSIK